MIQSHSAAATEMACKERYEAANVVVSTVANRATNSALRSPPSRFSHGASAGAERLQGSTRAEPSAEPEGVPCRKRTHPGARSPEAAGQGDAPDVASQALCVCCWLPAVPVVPPPSRPGCSRAGRSCRGRPRFSEPLGGTGGEQTRTMACFDTGALLGPGHVCG